MSRFSTEDESLIVDFFVFPDSALGIETPSQGRIQNRINRIIQIKDMLVIF